MEKTGTTRRSMGVIIAALLLCQCTPKQAPVYCACLFERDYLIQFPKTENDFSARDLDELKRALAFYRSKPGGRFVTIYNNSFGAPSQTPEELALAAAHVSTVKAFLIQHGVSQNRMRTFVTGDHDFLTLEDQNMYHSFNLTDSSGAEFRYVMLFVQ